MEVCVCVYVCVHVCACMVHTCIYVYSPKVAISHSTIPNDHLIMRTSKIELLNAIHHMNHITESTAFITTTLPYLAVQQCTHVYAYNLSLPPDADQFGMSSTQHCLPPPPPPAAWHCIVSSSFIPNSHMSLTCHSHVTHTLLTHVTHTSLTCHSHITHMSLTCHSHVTYTSLTRHSHVTLSSVNSFYDGFNGHPVKR